ncbi:hypothetical protein FQR65_LT03658 [Abscondita terminalis]|nr:hypothetical protein FQR65_LT03658 [Abscondita terminalis]
MENKSVVKILMLIVLLLNAVTYSEGFFSKCMKPIFCTISCCFTGGGCTGYCDNNECICGSPPRYPSNYY